MLLLDRPLLPGPEPGWWDAGHPAVRAVVLVAAGGRAGERLDAVSNGSLTQIPAAQSVTSQIFVDGMHLLMAVAATGTLIGGLVALVFLTSGAGTARNGSTSFADADATALRLGQRRAGVVGQPPR
jgi:hypothetical protein